VSDSITSISCGFVADFAVRQVVKLVVLYDLLFVLQLVADSGCGLLFWTCCWLSICCGFFFVPLVVQQTHNKSKLMESDTNLITGANITKTDRQKRTRWASGGSRNLLYAGTIQGVYRSGLEGQNPDEGLRAKPPQAGHTCFIFDRWNRFTDYWLHHKRRYYELTITTS